MAAVTSYGDLQAKLKEVRNKALEETALKSVILAKEVIEKEVYSVDTPEFYQRTYQLRDSLRDNPLENGGSNLAVIKIDHDRAAISPSAKNFQHASAWWSPWNYSGYLAKTVHDGLSGGLFGDNHAGMSSRPYMDETEKELKAGKYRKFMLDEIRAMGFKAK